MSQIVRFKSTIMVSREFLTQALDDLGYAWQENGRVVTTGVEIKLRGRSVGFRKAKSGYQLVARRGQDHSGFLQQVTQRYASLVARAKLEEQGFSLVNEEQKDGRVHLVLRRMA